MNNILIKLIGWKALLLHGDPTTYDRWEWLKRHLQEGPLRTLDAGCGSGVFTIFAAKLGNESIGISFDKATMETAKTRANLLNIPNVQFITADLRTLDQYRAALGLFDQILCLETIEHILNDKKLLKDLASLLKPRGRLFLTTPYKHYKRLMGDHILDYEDGGHVRWGYTHEEMKDLYNECGLEVLSQEYVSGFLSQQITNLMRLLGKLNYKLAWLLAFPLHLFLPLDGPLTKLLRYPYLSIGVVGVKRG